MPTLTTTNPVPEFFDPLPLRHILMWLKLKKKPEMICADEFPIFADDPLAQQHRVLEKYYLAASPEHHKAQPARITEGKAILDSPVEQYSAYLQAILARLLYQWIVGVEKVKDPHLGDRVLWRYGGRVETLVWMPLITALLRRNPPMESMELANLIDAGMIGGQVGWDIRQYFKTKAIVRAASDFVSRQGTKRSAHLAITRLRDQMKQEQKEALSTNREEKEMLQTLEELLGNVSPDKKQPVEPGEPWADAVLEVFKGKHSKNWEPLLNHAAAGDGAKPSGKWLKEAGKFIEQIGKDQFIKRMQDWLPLATQSRTVELRPEQITKVWHHTHDVFSDRNADVLKGLAWACAAANEEQLAQALGTLAESSFKKIRMVGPRCPKVGNACLIALTMLPGNAPRAELSRLKAKVKQPTAVKMIAKALGKSAEAAGMTTDDLEELAVGTFGLTEVGAGQEKIGSFTVDISITPNLKVKQTFTDSKGKVRSSVPAELSDKFAPALDESQKRCKELGKFLPLTRDRLERLPMNRRELPVSQWRERYLDHFVVGALARRLIWDFGDDKVGIWLDGTIVDVKGKPLKLDDKANVRLWHPIGASAATVLAWRNWLVKHEVVQPFKQAHREVYPLTEAERTTRTYSNRFAAHILRQNVLAALCTQRGWKYRLMGTWDGGDDVSPSIELPRWNLRAEYWLTGGEMPAEIANGVLRNVFTDQVRFYRAGEEAPMPLTDVPPLVFSEVMRDVDLFVGVCSIGNDPNWQEGSDRDAVYWREFSFGDLNLTAQTRRAVLENLLPRLKIAPLCKLDEKYLIVKGDLRSYKIHLGSSNILMEPNDQYLCIVPNQTSRTGDLYLPFEGDTMLSIILSKAFLLADDSKINDPTITRQISQK